MKPILHPRQVSLKIILGLGLCVTARADMTFTYSGSIQTWDVPVSGIYDITAFGAQGGNAAGGHNPGGNGAEISGDFNLIAGELLSVVVGGQGATSGFTGGGGGGSFVYTDSTPLIWGDLSQAAFKVV